MASKRITAADPKVAFDAEDEMPFMTYVRKLLMDLPYRCCTSCGLKSSSDGYDAMSLRMGAPLCMKHITGFPGSTAPAWDTVRAIPVKRAFVFLDFEAEMGPSGRPWQVGAVMCSGASFTALIKLPFGAVPARLAAESATLEHRLVMRSAYKIMAETEAAVMAKHHPRQRPEEVPDLDPELHRVRQRAHVQDDAGSERPLLARGPEGGLCRCRAPAPSRCPCRCRGPVEDHDFPAVLAGDGALLVHAHVRAAALLRVLGRRPDLAHARGRDDLRELGLSLTKAVTAAKPLPVGWA